MNHSNKLDFSARQLINQSTQMLQIQLFLLSLTGAKILAFLMLMLMLSTHLDYQTIRAQCLQNQGMATHRICL